MIVRGCFTLALLLGAFKCIGAFAAEITDHLDKKWSLTTVAPAGKAEILVYQAKEIVERKSRIAKVMQITESIGNPATALLVQWIKDVPVGIYNWHQQTQLWSNASQFRVVRLATSSQQWGQMTSVILDFAGGKSRERQGLIIGSSRDGANQQLNFNVSELKNTLPYETLPAVMRSIDFNRGGFSFTMIEPLTGLLLNAPRTGIAQVLFPPEETLSLYGKQIKVQPVVISHFLGEDRLWFEASEKRALIQWSRFNGSEYQLRSSKELDYWNLTQDSQIGLAE